MPRTKLIPDDELLAAVGVLLQQQGPAGLTFQSAGAITGLSPATLVQRFGSKDALLRAALLRMWDELDATTAKLDREQPANPAGAISMLLRLSLGYGATSDDAAQGLLLLREDFRDPALRARGVTWGDKLSKALGRRLSKDLAKSEALGRLMASQWQGALLWWGFSRAGTLHNHLRRELKTWCDAVGIKAA